jgi:hypothetical protein
VSILCSRHLQAQRVLATDGDVAVVEDINTNIFLNGLAGINRIEGSVFKWGHALLDGSLSFHDEMVDFDLVLGADIVSLSCHRKYLLLNHYPRPTMQSQFRLS